jgi:hypothetical protein
VLGMLRFELQDDDLFWQVLRNYLEEFNGGFARTPDFQRVVEETSGKDFDYFFDQWIYGEGFPTLYGDWYQKDKTLTMIVKEQTSSTNTTSLFEMYIPFQLIYKNGGDTTIVVRQESRNQTYKIPITQEVSKVYIDPENHILNKNLGMTQIVPTSANELLTSGYKVYPNPFTSELQVLVPEMNRDLSFRIYNANGGLVHAGSLTAGIKRIDATMLQPGMYIFEIASYEGLFRQKIINH